MKNWREFWLTFAVIAAIFISIIAIKGANAADTADALNNVVDKVSAGLADLSAKIESAAPAAWKLVVAGNYTQAAVNIFIAEVFIGILVYFWALSATTARVGWNASIRNKNHYSSSDGEGWYGFAIALFVAGTCSGLIGLVIIGVNYAMYVSPEAMTARDFLFTAIGR